MYLFPMLLVSLIPRYGIISTAPVKGKCYLGWSIRLDWVDTFNAMDLVTLTFRPEMEPNL